MINRKLCIKSVFFDLYFLSFEYIIFILLKVLHTQLGFNPFPPPPTSKLRFIIFFFYSDEPKVK